MYLFYRERKKKNLNNLFSKKRMEILLTFHLVKTTLIARLTKKLSSRVHGLLFRKTKDATCMNAASSSSLLCTRPTTVTQQTNYSTLLYHMPNNCMYYYTTN